MGSVAGPWAERSSNKLTKAGRHSLSVFSPWNRTEANLGGGPFITLHPNWCAALKARLPCWLWAHAWNDDIIFALLKQKENSSPERGKMGRKRESKEIKKSRGMREVSERAMNHSDIPGRVSEDAAVWSWINTRPLNQSFLKSGQVTACYWPSATKSLPCLNGNSKSQVFFFVFVFWRGCAQLAAG